MACKRKRSPLTDNALRSKISGAVFVFRFAAPTRLVAALRGDKPLNLGIEADFVRAGINVSRVTSRIKL